jgi:hypothetical protein
MKLGLLKVAVTVVMISMILVSDYGIVQNVIVNMIYMLI